MDDKEPLLISIENEHTMLIRLNRPKALNALNNDVLIRFNKAFDDARNNAAIKVVVITGHGKAFCAGADITELEGLDEKTGTEFAKFGQGVFRALEKLNKPSIALVNGYAFGGGCELAMSASIRLASASAQFSQPEVKLAVIPGFGGTQRLSRLIGKGRAIDLCLTGRVINATDALSYGLVSDVIDENELEEKGFALASKIASLPPVAMESILSTINDGYDMQLDEAFDLEARHFGKVCATEDKKTGVNAFLNKEKAIFLGR